MSFSGLHVLSCLPCPLLLATDVRTAVCVQHGCVSSVAGRGHSSRQVLFVPEYASSIRCKDLFRDCVSSVTCCDSSSRQEVCGPPKRFIICCNNILRVCVSVVASRGFSTRKVVFGPLCSAFRCNDTLRDYVPSVRALGLLIGT